ncbi:HK97-gp10 family putative phage morphogenesis protein [Massilia sp. UBA6681]|uniref:HK97-gp10 family putative phage morphogenesis protein n=1 Tax=Massilia sp. UBA6681 TaxID=1946839 RepID=UPI0025BF9D38|nr:HK97-gp10 family putative phage morphogenesis protein [Massilia sp. UBA6681]
MITIDASNLSEVLGDLLSRVEESVGESTLRTIGFEGAEIFKDQVKQNALAHKKTGILFDNIIVVRVTEESEANKRQVYKITVRNGTGSSPGGFYWRFVEKGHKIVPPNRKRSAKTGRTIGWAAHRRAAELEYGSRKVPAYPFFRPAYESKKQESVDAMTRTLSEILARNT